MSVATERVFLCFNTWHH